MYVNFISFMKDRSLERWTEFSNYEKY